MGDETRWTRIARGADGTYRTDNIGGVIDLLWHNGFERHRPMGMDHLPDEVVRMARGELGGNWALVIIRTDGEIRIHGPESQAVQDVLMGGNS